MMLVDTLTGAGFHVLETADAGEGFRILMAGDPVALVIADVGLSGEMDGVTLAKVVLEHWPNTRVLVISGHTDPKELNLPPQVAFMAKPVPPPMLLNKIEEMLGPGAGQQE